MGPRFLLASPRSSFDDGAVDEEVQREHGQQGDDVEGDVNLLERFEERFGEDVGDLVALARIHQARAGDFSGSVAVSFVQRDVRARRLPRVIGTGSVQLGSVRAVGHDSVHGIHA